MYTNQVMEADYVGSHFTIDEPQHSLLHGRLLLAYSHAEDTLHIKWEGAVDSGELRQGYAFIMDMVCSFKPRKWVMDLQNRISIDKHDQHWVFTCIFPEVLRIVQKDVFVGVIMPVFHYSSLVNEISGDELIDGDNFIIISHFLYQEECRRWLHDMTSTTKSLTAM